MDNVDNYIGRFAPSPTGSLHMGSLVAALGSYLRAKNHNGQWLVRMEDLDPLREVPCVADEILQTLEDHALYWDGEVIYQSHSQRQALYSNALQQLIDAGQVYTCTCTRKVLIRAAERGEFGIIYPGTCAKAHHSFELSRAIRVRTHNDPVCFDDVYKGRQCQNLQEELGDFVIKRSDGYFAYQLAVVVDDEAQGITEIVRGEDLLNNTQRQIHLQQLLGYKQPAYCHLPMVTNQQGQKLSKQTHAPALKKEDASLNLIQALTFLGVYNPDNRTIDKNNLDKNPEKDILRLKHETPEAILQWSILNNDL
ncbi:MAG: tRNA glutamyl-Q(34) synthetase GluQRS [Thiotrichaceae bacterium]